MFNTHLDSLDAGVVLIMAVLEYAGVIVVVVVVEVLVLSEIVVAAPDCIIMTSFVFQISSSIFWEAPSHLTQKCKTSVDHEVTTAGVLFSRFSYQSLASKSEQQ